MPPMPEHIQTLQQKVDSMKYGMALVEVLVFGVAEEMQHALDHRARPTRQCFQVWAESLIHALTLLKKAAGK